MDFGFILYIGIVVGNVPNLKHMITGGRTSLFLTSQRMPSRYGRVRILYSNKKEPVIPILPYIPICEEFSMRNA